MKQHSASGQVLTYPLQGLQFASGFQSSPLTFTTLLTKWLFHHMDLAWSWLQLKILHYIFSLLSKSSSSLSDEARFCDISTILCPCIYHHQSQGTQILDFLASIYKQTVSYLKPRVHIIKILCIINTYIAPTTCQVLFNVLAYEKNTFSLILQMRELKYN